MITEVTVDSDSESEKRGESEANLKLSLSFKLVVSSSETLAVICKLAGPRRDSETCQSRVTEVDSESPSQTVTRDSVSDSDTGTQACSLTPSHWHGDRPTESRVTVRGRWGASTVTARRRSRGTVRVRDGGTEAHWQASGSTVTEPESRSRSVRYGHDAPLLTQCSGCRRLGGRRRRRANGDSVSLALTTAGVTGGHGSAARAPSRRGLPGRSHVGSPSPSPLTARAAASALSPAPERRPLPVLTESCQCQCPVIRP
jgi:hypothetical protein